MSKHERNFTDADRQNVRLWAAAGLSRATISRILKVRRGSLKAHFAEELSDGAEMELAHNLERLRVAAESGNVSAIKFLHQLLSEAHADASFKAPQAVAEVPQQSGSGYKSKKAQALVDAREAGKGSEWGHDLEQPATNVPEPTTLNGRGPKTIN